jgi:hypothetical protein
MGNSQQKQRESGGRGGSERERERQALHLGRDRLAKIGGKQCYKQAGNQRELVRPREPGSLACN